jgi:hypothetical protein
MILGTIGNVVLNKWINRRVRHLDDGMTGKVVSSESSDNQFLLRVCWDDNSVDMHDPSQLVQIYQ